MKPKTTTARQLRRLIARAGLNQVTAAEAIGVSPRAMRRYVSLDPVVHRPPPRPVVLALEGLVARSRTGRENRVQGGEAFTEREQGSKVNSSGDVQR